ncbi:MAG TPA: DUF488 domain-containing protein [Thermomicrobiales bacterium]|nr:DUF488 domain-containing protein [Thermomicrobiales bacterium]
MSKLTGQFKLRRAYDSPSPDDGQRILVDRFWPRGISKERAQLELWLRDAAPSAELCRWFGHDVERWPEFRERYRAELDANQEALEPLLEAARQGDVTLVFGARDTAHNQAVVLKEYLEERLADADPR